MLSAHYRSPLNFSADLMLAAKSGLERILTAYEKLTDDLEKSVIVKLTADETKKLGETMEFVSKFEAAMDDDFNTADAVAAVFELVKYINIQISSYNSKEFITHVKDELNTLCDILGIITEKEKEMLDEEIEQLIEERQQARKAKNFARADEIRDELLSKGIVLEDTREGVKWKKA